MHWYPWSIRTAVNVCRMRGIHFLFRKGIRHAYLTLHANTGGQWWRSLKSLEDANERLLSYVAAHSRDGTRSGEALLNQAFRQSMQVYPGLPPEYITVLLESIEKRHVVYDFSDGVQEELLEQTRELDPLALPVVRWFALQFVCLWNGLLKTAYQVRQKAVEQAYLYAEDFRTAHLVAAFTAAIDQAEFERADVYLDYLKKRNLNHSFDELESYYYLNTGNSEEFKKRTGKNLDSIDRKFLEYLEGRSVALVGPAPSGVDQGDEIDSYDIVVRFNYRGWEVLPDRKSSGTRTSISYYNRPFSKEISESGLNPYQEIDFGVFKKIEYDAQRELLESQKARVLKKISQFYHGAPLIGNLALYDILQFRPGPMKMFNINYYLSDSPYYAGYSEREAVNKFFLRTLFGSFAHHDIMSNINFTRNLWNAGLIEVDRACRDVLKLNTCEYLSAIEKLFFQDI